MSMFGQKSGAKPLASLSSTLLARKGQAKPAMRPQGYGGFGAMPGQHDDLGWNDMGGDLGGPVEIDTHAAVSQPVPPVLLQREVLAGEFSAPAPVAPIAEPVPPGAPEAVPEPRALKPVSVATAARLERETVRKIGKKHAKAAFTLRLDQDRHLRLRLASALEGESAQMLVTAALDTFLQSLPEVDALVAQLPRRKTPKSKGE